MSENYTVFHLHGAHSNPTTTMDSVTNYKDYVDKASSLGMKSIGFSEHGNIFEWLHKKEYIESKGMKYIHGCEVYVTESIEEKKRDNYHCILISRNFEGFLELNKLISKSFNRADVKILDDKERFYFNPRITYDELKKTSDNIIISTACIGGILYKGNLDIKKDFLKFLIKNKDRVFLEIQHHQDEKQKKYNQTLLNIHNKTGLRLIAGTDTHSLNKDHVEGRAILQKSKNIFFGDESGWDIEFKSYEDLLDAYEKQNALSKDIYIEAIENTNLLSDMIEEFTLDKNHKYPELYENSEDIFKKKIKQGIKNRGIALNKDIANRINHEFKTMKENGSMDYMLLEENIKQWCRENDILYGYSRGSVSGSEIAYLLNVTDMDSIKFNLNFERFQNPERVSLCDVDTDYSPFDREKVKDYIYSIDGLKCADIITFNTIAEKGAIRDVGRALNMPLSEVDSISKKFDYEEDGLRKKYPKLFRYVDMLKGVIVSTGSHPAGVVVSPITLEDNVGLCTLKTSKYPISQLNMKEIDSLNFVKLDILGLDNVEIINKTCKLANIERLTPDNMDVLDENVWENIKKSGLAIFQWESESAISYYRQLFGNKTLDKIKKDNPDFSYIDLFSIGNGAIRPAGESYRDALAKGEFRDNGHPVLNEFLKSTRGFLVFQEQIIEFLNKFCGFSMGEADIIRRGFSKKTGTEQYIPKIKEGFIETMINNYGVNKEASENLIVDFIQVIEDASSYLFSLNHSQSYSYIGYACAWLRHYYPLEFLTVVLNVNENKEQKTAKVMDYINKYTEIKVKPIKFRYSHAKYTMDKSTNSIYKGIQSIKYMNEQIAEELYNLRNNSYNNFVSLLVDVIENTSCNSRQLEILIKLGFFGEFGKTGKLLNIYDEFSNGSNKYKKTYVDKTKQKRIVELIKYEDNLEDIGLPLNEILSYEMEYLGYMKTINEDIPLDFAVISNIETNKWGTTFVDLYRLQNGETQNVKIRKSTIETKPLDQFDMIKTITLEKVKKKRKIDGKWTEIDETEDILFKYAKVKV